MRARVPTRQFIALLTAYLLAAQALLLPLSVALAAPAPFNDRLCLSGPPGSPDTGHSPADTGHSGDCCAACGTPCCVPGLAEVPADRLTPPQARRIAVDAPASREAPRLPLRRPAQQPRAPPGRPA